MHIIDVVIAWMGRWRGRAAPTETVGRSADSHDLRQRPIELRAERSGEDSRFLSAALDDGGNLVISGQDLGPATAIVSDDGEYEWIQVIAARDIPTLLQHLDAPLDSNVLEVLEAQWTGPNSYELERIIRASEIPSNVSVWR